MVLNATNRTRYSIVAMLFHWTIAVLVILNWRLAENAHHAKGAAGAALMSDHKAFASSSWC